MNFAKLLLIFIFTGLYSHILSQDKFKIAVVGDTPYKHSDWKVLKMKFNQLEDSGYHLLIHVGDIKRGVLPCFRRRYKRVSKLLNYSTVPYLIIPGDNEYNDCYCRGPKRALTLWRKHTLNTDPDNQFNISRSEHLPENFSFIKDSTLFIGIHNVGGRTHDSLEWDTRTNYNLNWIFSEVQKQIKLYKSIVIFSHASPKNEFRSFLFSYAQHSESKIYFIQGDIHSFSHTKNWEGSKVTRIVVDNGNELPMFRTLLIFNGLISIK